MSYSMRTFLALLLAAPLVAAPSFAFDTPLSDQAVREAYFLGQRHDDSMAKLLDRYTQFLPAPEAGPHIYSVTFLTPFALLVQQSSQLSNASAQEVEKRHHGVDEIVSVSIEILLTPSFGAAIPTPTNSRSGSPVGYQFRNPDFWKDFKIKVFDGEKNIALSGFTGEPKYACASKGGCDLFGATIRFELPAKLFTSNSSTIEITPPVGEQVSVDFDLASLR
jgi:hypothetical protein